MPSAVIGGSIAAAGAMGASALSSSSADKRQEQALQAQQDLTSPQKQMMTAYLPFYRGKYLPYQTRILEQYKKFQPKLTRTQLRTQTKLYERLLPLIQQQLKGEKLPAATSRNLREARLEAKDRMGVYGASRGMLSSGITDKMWSDIESESLGQRLNALLAQQGQGTSTALSLLSEGPGQYSAPPAPAQPYPQPVQQGGGGSMPMDFSGIGRMMAGMGQNPTAMPIDPTGSYNVGYGAGSYPGGYSRMAF